MILLQLFWAFFQVGLFSIGGGYAALPSIQQQVVITGEQVPPCKLIHAFVTDETVERL